MLLVSTLSVATTVQTGIEGKKSESGLAFDSTELKIFVWVRLDELEIEQTKSNAKKSVYLALDNAGAWLKEYLNELMPQTMLTAEEWIARINAVTISEIQVINAWNFKRSSFWKGDSS